MKLVFLISLFLYASGQAETVLQRPIEPPNNTGRTPCPKSPPASACDRARCYYHDARDGHDKTGWNCMRKLCDGARAKGVKEEKLGASRWDPDLRMNNYYSCEEGGIQEKNPISYGFWQRCMGKGSPMAKQLQTVGDWWMLECGGINDSKVPITCCQITTATNSSIHYDVLMTKWGCNASNGTSVENSLCEPDKALLDQLDKDGALLPPKGSEDMYTYSHANTPISHDTSKP